MITWVHPDRLARSARPDLDDVEGWMAEARRMGIRSIVCLLDDTQVERYAHLPGGLLGTYRRGGFRVAHVPIRDLQTPPIPETDLAMIGRLFDELPAPVVVHCWAGIDRTGAAVAYLERRMDETGSG